ncbi:hypothetical protein DFJ74DRAFT_660723 [Hyaloraphidium curvatum]|nr:hypothetical protein DFJ74DRAFT_660723 [Hyaloraphidium curvatum]
MASPDFDPHDHLSVKAKFDKLLQTLTGSAKSVETVADFALEHGRNAQIFCRCIKERMKTVELREGRPRDPKSLMEKRLGLLHVVDRICQKERAGGAKDFVDEVHAEIEGMVSLIFEVGKVDKGLAETFESTMAAVEKVLGAWKMKKVFQDSTIEQMQQQIQLLRREQQQATRKQSEQDAAENKKILRRMEEDRDKQKKAREEAWQRPVGETDEMEFEDAWENTSEFNDSDAAEVLVLQEIEALDLQGYFDGEQQMDDIEASYGKPAGPRPFIGNHPKENGFNLPQGMRQVTEPPDFIFNLWRQSPGLPRGKEGYPRPAFPDTFPGLDSAGANQSPPQQPGLDGKSPGQPLAPPGFPQPPPNFLARPAGLAPPFSRSQEPGGRDSFPGNGSALPSAGFKPSPARPLDNRAGQPRKDFGSQASAPQTYRSGQFASSGSQNRSDLPPPPPPPQPPPPLPQRPRDRSPGRSGGHRGESKPSVPSKRQRSRSRDRSQSRHHSPSRRKSPRDRTPPRHRSRERSPDRRRSPGQHRGSDRHRSPGRGRSQDRHRSLRRGRSPEHWEGKNARSDSRDARRSSQVNGSGGSLPPLCWFAEGVLTFVESINPDNRNPPLYVQQNAKAFEKLHEEADLLTTWVSRELLFLDSLKFLDHLEKEVQPQLPPRDYDFSRDSLSRQHGDSPEPYLDAFGNAPQEVAYRIHEIHRRFAFYSTADLHQRLGKEFEERHIKFLEELNRNTHTAAKHVRYLVHELHEKRVRQRVISLQGISHTFAKLMLFRLNKYFKPDEIMVARGRVGDLLRRVNRLPDDPTIILPLGGRTVLENPNEKDRSTCPFFEFREDPPDLREFSQRFRIPESYWLR